MTVEVAERFAPLSSLRHRQQQQCYCMGIPLLAQTPAGDDDDDDTEQLRQQQRIPVPSFDLVPVEETATAAASDPCS